MSNFASIQFDSQGNEIANDISIEMERGDKPETPASVRDVNALNASLKAASYQIGGGAAKDAAMAEEAQAFIDTFTEDLDRLQSVTSAGRTLDKQTLEGLQHKVNDTAMAWVRAGGNVNDEQMVNLRARVDTISAAARTNR